MSKISVIVPVYKVEAYLDACVESILAQTHNDLEILLVDDGSPDNCPRMCDTWAERDPRIRVIHKENGGQSSARNRALDVMTGDYVLFVDSDDLIHPQMCEILLFLLTSQNSDIAMCGYTRFYDDDPLSLPPISQEELSYETVDCMSWYRQNMMYTHSVVWNQLYRKKVFSTSRFREGMIYEDTHLLPYLWKQAGTLTYCRISLYFYRQNQTGTMQSGLSAKKFSVLYVYADHYRMYQRDHCDEAAVAAAINIVLRMTKGSVLRKKYSLTSVFLKHWFRYLFLVLLMPKKHLSFKYKLLYLSLALPFPFLHRIYQKRLPAIDFNDENNL